MGRRSFVFDQAVRIYSGIARRLPQDSVQNPLYIAPPMGICELGCPRLEEKLWRNRIVVPLVPVVD